MVQWLRLLTPSAGGLGLIPGQGTRSHKPQLTICTPQLRAGAAEEKMFLKVQWQRQGRYIVGTKETAEPGNVQKVNQSEE